jgi:HD-like signal output (HDOD) protein
VESHRRAAAPDRAPPEATPDRAPPELTPFEFVRSLAADLSSGELKLPSFPDLAARVRRVLDDSRATPAQVAAVVGSDTALAARTLRIANSAVYNPSGTYITSLQTAIGRLGHDAVRCAAVSFALQQMREAVRHPDLKRPLQEVWRRSTLVAAVAHAVAHRTKATSADEAMLTGLLHNVGWLYVVSRAAKYAEAFRASGTWDEVLQDWHPQIGRAILEHWRFPEHVAVAVGEQNVADRPRGPGSALPDVLVCAVALSTSIQHRHAFEDIVADISAFHRLGLDAARCRLLVVDSTHQIQQMREALAA